MRPQDILDLPTLETTAWWDAPTLIETVFPDLPPLDIFTARDADDRRLTIATKAHAFLDSGRIAAVYAFALDGKLFCVVQAGGRSPADNLTCLTLDADRRRAALWHLLAYTDCMTAEVDTVPADRDAPALGEVAGQKLVRRKGGGYTFVPAGTHAESGNRIFDPDAFEAAVAAIPRMDSFDDPTRKALVDAALAAVPEGVHAVAVDGIHGQDTARERAGTWIAIAIRDMDGEILVLSRDLALLWAVGPTTMAGARPRRVQDPELRAALRFDGQPHAFQHS